MIQAIYNIGKFILHRENKDVSNSLEILIQKPFTKSQNKYVLAILLEKKLDLFNYIRIESEEYDSSKLEKYLYRKGSPRGTDLLPTSIVTEVKKTFPIKIVNWFKQFRMQKGKNQLSNDNIQFITALDRCIQDNYSQIIKDLEEIIKILSKNEGILITIKILDGKKINYLGDIPLFKHHLVQQSKIDYYYSKKYKVQSRMEEGLCSICLQKKPEVFGFVQTYNFYTVDKTGFLAGGFNRENACLNYPVCLECALTLEVGKKFIDDNLTFNFYGIPYKLIPKFILNQGFAEIFEVLEQYQKSPKITEESRKQITGDEREILELLSEQENSLNLNLLFFQQQQSAFRILQYVEDILPSRLKRLFEVKRELEQMELFKNYSDNKFPLKFNFSILRKIFPRSSRLDFYRRNFDKYFLDLTNKIFSNKLIDYEFILTAIMKELRVKLWHDKFYSFRTLTVQSFMLLLFLERLKLLRKKGDDGLKKEISSTLIEFDSSDETTNKIQQIFDEFPETFQNYVEKVTFLVGVLTDFLLKIQFLERNAKPFMSKLQGLKMDEKLIKRLFPEVQNKLIEYGKNYYTKLETIISKYFLLAGNDWKSSNDEISFYFTLGLNLSYLFKKRKKED